MSVIARREIWALIPIKRLTLAKTRLEPALDPASRAELAKAMLEDVLAALGASAAVSGALVVTSDPAAAEIARRVGAAAINDAFETGVNSAVDQGLKCLARWNATGAIVVPADVPLITSAEIDEVAAALEEARFVLAPAERDGGTNVFAVSPVDAIAPAFGANSLVRHVEAARSAGIKPRIIPLSGAGLDIDIPDDLDRLALRGLKTRAGRLLLERSANRAPRSARPLPERTMQQ